MDCIQAYKNRWYPPAGFTLAEVIISVLIIMVLATGAMGYQYASTRDVKVSEVQAGATRIAALLLESWKGQQGDTDFDPVDIFGDTMIIQASGTGPDVPDGTSLIPLGSYEIALSSTYYYTTLSYAQQTDSEPMLLNAVVTWLRDYGQGTLSGQEASVCHSTYAVSY